MKNLETPEFYIFRGYLDAVSDLTYSGNYETWFEVKGFELNNTEFAPEKLIDEAYPENAPTDQSKFSQCSVREMAEKIKEGLTIYIHRVIEKDGAAYGVYLLQTRLFEGYMKHLGACIEYEKSVILEYEGDLTYLSIMWGFAFLVYNEDQRRCLIIHGGSSD